MKRRFNKNLPIIFLVWALVLGQTGLLPAYALAPQSLFQQNSTAAETEEVRPSVLSDIKLTIVISAIGKHCLLKGRSVRTISRMIRSEFGRDPSFYKGLDLSLPDTFTQDGRMVSIKYKDPSDGNMRLLRIIPRDIIKPGDSRWKVCGEFGVDDGREDIVSSTAIAVEEKIKRKNIVELSAADGSLKALFVSTDSVRKPSEIRAIFNSEEAGRFVDYIKEHKVMGRPVTFRVALDEAGFGWDSVAQHAAVSVLNKKDGVIYIGRDLLKRMFQKDGEVLRDEILLKDLFRDLEVAGQQDAEEYALRSHFVKTALENIRLRSEASEMKIPDFASISLRKLIDEAPEVADYHRLHTDECSKFESIVGFGEKAKKLDCYYFKGDAELYSEGANDIYKVLHHQKVYAPDGSPEGSIFVYYHINRGKAKPEEQDNSITLVLRGAGRNRPIIHESDVRRGEEGWDEAIIKVYLDANSDHVTMIDYRANAAKMSLSRTAIGIMIEDAGMTGDLNALCGLIEEYLVFPDLTEDVRLRERRDEIPVPMSIYKRVTADPAHALEKDIKAIEDFAYYKSWTVRQIAMDAISAVCKAGKISSARAALAEAHFGNVDILEDRLFIKRFLIEEPGLLGKVFSSISGEDAARVKDLLSVDIKWLGKGNNKSVYRVRFNTKNGRSFMAAVSTVRHNPRNPDFDRPSLEKSISRWVALSEKGNSSVPKVINYQWASDFRPRMTDLISDMYSVYNKSDKEWIRNDIGVVFRTFKEGDDLDWTLSNPVLSSQEKMKMKKVALETYLDIWNSTRTADGKGQFIGDPKPANIVVWREGKAYRAQAIDLDLLREFENFEAVKATLRMYHDYDDIDIFESDGKAMVAEKPEPTLIGDCSVTYIDKKNLLSKDYIRSASEVALKYFERYKELVIDMSSSEPRVVFGDIKAVSADGGKEEYYLRMVCTVAPAGSYTRGGMPDFYLPDSLYTASHAGWVAEIHRPTPESERALENPWTGSEKLTDVFEEEAIDAMVNASEEKVLFFLMSFGKDRFFYSSAIPVYGYKDEETGNVRFIVSGADHNGVGGQELAVKETVKKKLGPENYPSKGDIRGTINKPLDDMGGFIRLDPPISEEQIFEYCRTKNIRMEDFEESIVADCGTAIESFAKISSEYKPLILHDELRRIYLKRGIVISDPITIGEAVKLLKQSRATLPQYTPKYARLFKLRDDCRADVSSITESDLVGMVALLNDPDQVTRRLARSICVFAIGRKAPCVTQRVLKLVDEAAAVKDPSISALSVLYTVHTDRGDLIERMAGGLLSKMEIEDVSRISSITTQSNDGTAFEAVDSLSQILQSAAVDILISNYENKLRYSSGTISIAPNAGLIFNVMPARFTSETSKEFTVESYHYDQGVQTTPLDSDDKPYLPLNIVDMSGTFHCTINGTLRTGFGYVFPSNSRHGVYTGPDFKKGFIRLDPPVTEEDIKSYCRRNGDSPQYFEKRVAIDCAMIIKRFLRISDPAKPLVLHDELRRIFKKRGIIMPDKLTLGEAAELIDKAPAAIDDIAMRLTSDVKESTDNTAVFVMSADAAGNLRDFASDPASVNGVLYDTSLHQHINDVPISGESRLRDSIMVDFSSSFRGAIKDDPTSDKGFIRIDPPMDRRKYCLKKNVSESLYEETVTDDYKAILKGLSLCINLKKPFVLADDVKDIFARCGVVLPAVFNIEEALSLMCGNKPAVPAESTAVVPDIPEGAAVKNVTIVPEHGIHGRVAVAMINAATGFKDTEVKVIKSGQTGSCRSISSLMLLGASCGAQVTVYATGKDREKALKAMTTVLGCHEDANGNPILPSTDTGIKSAISQPEFAAIIEDILETFRSSPEMKGMDDFNALKAYIDKKYPSFVKCVSEEYKRRDLLFVLIAYLNKIKENKNLHYMVSGHPAVLSVYRENTGSYKSFEGDFIDIALANVPPTVTTLEEFALYLKKFPMLPGNANVLNCVSVALHRLQGGNIGSSGYCAGAQKILEDMRKKEEKERRIVSEKVFVPEVNVGPDLAKSISDTWKNIRGGIRYLSITKNGVKADGSNLIQLLFLDMRAGDEIVIESQGEKSEEAAAEITKLIAGYIPQSEIQFDPASPERFGEFLKGAMLEQSEGIDGGSINGSARPFGAVFIVFIAKDGKTYLRHGPRTSAEYLGTETIIGPEHYDGVRTGGVYQHDKYIFTDFDEGVFKDKTPYFRGSYNFYMKEGSDGITRSSEDDPYLRIDAPGNPIFYCSVKGIPVSGYSKAIFNDYVTMLRGLNKTLPRPKITELIVTDDVRVLLSSRGVNLPSAITLQKAVLIIDKVAAEDRTPAISETTAATNVIPQGAAIKRVILAPQLGIHMRLAAKIVNMANRFAGVEIIILKKDNKASCRSISGLMFLGASKGAGLTVYATGEGKEAALRAIVEILETEEDQPTIIDRGAVELHGYSYDGYGLGRKICDDDPWLPFAMNEIIKNAYVHGNGENKNLSIDIKWEKTPEKLTISIIDKGRFDFDLQRHIKISDAAADNLLQAAAANINYGEDMSLYGAGLGVYSANQSVDEMRASDFKDEEGKKIGTEVILKINLINGKVPESAKTSLGKGFGKLYEITPGAMLTVEKYIDARSSGMPFRMREAAARKELSCMLSAGLIERNSDSNGMYNYRVREEIRGFDPETIKEIMAILEPLDGILKHTDMPDKLRDVITNKTAETLMGKIHNMNCELLPVSQDGTVIVHLISEELVPANIRSDFKAMTRRLELECPDMSERIEVLKASEISVRSAAIIAEGNKVDVALPDWWFVTSIPKAAKVLVFESEKSPGAMDFVQLEGIIAALRALERQDAASLVKIYSILANKEFNGSMADINKFIEDGDWQGVARTIIFKLRPVEIHDLKDLKKLNDRLLDFIKYA